MTASDIINKYQNSTLEEIMHEPPGVISAEIVLLSAKLWEAGSLTLLAEQANARKFMEIRSTADTDGMAKEILKTTTEYADLKKAQTSEKTVLEVIRSLKRLLLSKSDEAKNLY